MDTSSSEELQSLQTGRIRTMRGIGRGRRNKVNPLIACRDETRHITYQFTQQSSMHGLQYIGSTVNPGLRRLFWVCCFIASVAFFLNAVIPRIRDYLRNPVVTKISIERAHPMTFPAVTLCNFNPYRKSILAKKPEVATIVQSAYKSSSSEYIGLKGINQSDPAINHTLHNTIMHEVVVEAAHPLQPMMWQCQWKGEDIHCDEFFTKSNTDFGICYTFNSREFQDINGTLETNSTGSNYGLYLKMNVEHDEYYIQNPLSNSAGIKPPSFNKTRTLMAWLAEKLTTWATSLTPRTRLEILLHDANSLPLVKEFGIAVTPGTENFIGIRKVKNSFLPPPAENSHCRDTASANFRNPLAYYPTYSYSACRYECLANYTLEKCKCRGALMPGYGNYCTIYDYFACELTMERVYSRKEDPLLRCDCFMPCQQIDFDLRLSSALYPGDHTIEYLKQKLNLSEHHLRHNFLEIRIFFEELNYKWIWQAPEYNLQQMIADIGGQAGFCIGASVLSIMELGEWLLNIFIGLFRTLTGRSRSNKSGMEEHEMTITQI